MRSTLTKSPPTPNRSTSHKINSHWINFPQDQLHYYIGSIVKIFMGTKVNKGAKLFPVTTQVAQNGRISHLCMVAKVLNNLATQRLQRSVI